MNRSHASKNVVNFVDSKELLRKTAIHEAGHAAGIYLGNLAKQLPPVHFQIVLKREHNRPRLIAHQAHALDGFAKIEGGRLLHTLPSSLAEVFAELSAEQALAYQKAFEADIVNYLIGPLAEANYVALRDDEVFNPNLINKAALGNYGGRYDLEVVDEYLQCLADDFALKQQKIDALFLEAFHFVNDRANWFAIASLANFILADNKTVIPCEEAIAVMDAGLISAKKRVWRY